MNSRKPSYIILMGVAFLLSAQCPLSNRYGTVFGSFGLGEAFVTSSSAAMVADYCQARHYGAAMGTFGTIFDIGHVSSPIVTGLLVASLAMARPLSSLLPC